MLRAHEGLIRVFANVENEIQIDKDFEICIFFSVLYNFYGKLCFFVIWLLGVKPTKTKKPY